MNRCHVPQLHEFFNSQLEAQESFLQAGENYLRKLLGSSELRSRSTVIFEFLELSLLEFPEGTSSLKEGYLRKKSGGRFKRNKPSHYFSTVFSSWHERWFILTKEAVLYTMNSTSPKSREMIFFDQTFQIDYDFKTYGTIIEISLITPNRRLNLQANNLLEALDWVSEIKKAARESPYTKINRFLSYAPIRGPMHFCKWYVDAAGYFEELLEALMQAKKEIFITDWWLSPELELRKSVKDESAEYRLDHVLGNIASRGVKVYVILYHEVKKVMYNDSEHTKRVLHNISPNIIVLKHPTEPFFPWSHHEKLVVIDQTTGFIGGIDLCFGRSDTSDHLLHDPAFVEGSGETFPGQDYCNPRIADFKNVKQYHKPRVDKKTVPRMPFHDAMIKVIGPAVNDMCRHFFQYWNHVNIDCYRKKIELPLPNHMQLAVNGAAPTKKNIKMKLRSEFREIVGMREDFGAATPNTHSTNDENTKSSIAKAGLVGRDPTAGSPAKETQNTVSNRPFAAKLREDVYENTLVSELKVEGITEEAPKKRTLKVVNDRSVSKELRKMSNATFGYGEPEEVKHTGYLYQYLSTNEEEKDFTESESLPTNIRSKEHNGKSPIQLSQRRRCDLKDSNQSIYESFQDQIEGNCSCQILRSASKWSLGLNTDDGKFENSIQNAYIELIQNSKNFIYIENQFFLSGTAGKEIRNGVGQALVDRIEKAHARQENFRVLVFIPLLPAFEGEVTDSKAALLRIQIYWQHRTICRGGESIYEQLKTKGICPQDYIQFYSLRTHGRMMNGEPVSEMIYIHSKILIIDDNIMLIGSANLNDRSLQGSRDSEIAIVVEDSNKILSYMNGGEVQVGQFACSLRRRLLAEHLGCQEDDVTDPLSSEFTNILNKTAERNTQIYREIFACYPDDNQKNLKDIHKMAQEKDLDKYDKLAPKIQGRVVWYPLEFLSEENLAAPLDTKEYYIPSHLFV